MSATIAELVAAGSSKPQSCDDPEAAFEAIADALAQQASSLSEADRATEMERLKADGNDAFKTGDAKQAVYKYSCAIVFAPDNAVLFSNRAAAHIKLEEYGSSLHDAEQAIKLDSGFIKAHYRRGASHMALGKFGDAVDDFRLVLKLKPGDAEAKKRLQYCKKAHLEQQFALAIAMEQTKLASELIDLSAISVSDSYTGPRIDFSLPLKKRYSIETVQAIMDLFKDEKTKDLPRQYVYGILVDFISIVNKYPSLVDIDVAEGGKLTVCGDTHGQYYDVLKIFRLNGMPSEDNPYLFNGDFVDRGSFSVEVALSLFLLKLCYPNSVHLTRGNHESTNMNMAYGFKGEVLAKCDEKTFDLFTEAFNWLPIAYCIGKKVLVLHGGLFSDEVTLDDIRAVKRFRQPPESGIMCDALWSDPGARNGRNPPHRGCGVVFGPDITKKFCEANGLKLVVRSHEMKQAGYSVDHNGMCVTVFSAPNYCDQGNNKGAFLVFDDDLDYEAKQFTAAPHPNVRAMAYANPMLYM
jgi:serine/threonine-protein phosphatase 5